MSDQMISSMVKFDPPRRKQNNLTRLDMCRLTLHPYDVLVWLNGCTLNMRYLVSMGNMFFE